MSALPKPANPLQGLRVLAVEDESMVAMLLEDMLGELGCVVIGPAGRVDQALALLEISTPDAAVLDVNLAGDKVFPVARRLAQLGVPFVFATGYGIEGLAGQHEGRQVLQKPYRIDAVQQALETAIADL